MVAGLIHTYVPSSCILLSAPGQNVGALPGNGLRGSRSCANPMQWYFDFVLLGRLRAIPPAELQALIHRFPDCSILQLAGGADTSFSLEATAACDEVGRGGPLLRVARTT